MFAISLLFASKEHIHLSLILLFRSDLASYMTNKVHLKTFFFSKAFLKRLKKQYMWTLISELRATRSQLHVARRLLVNAHFKFYECDTNNRVFLNLLFMSEHESYD